jgi:hypothetical protein
MRIVVRMSIVLSLAVASSLHAVTYIVPSDRDLVKRAEAIVVATAVESHSKFTENGGIVTVARLALKEVLKGDLDDVASIDLTELGGSIGDHGVSIPGSPRYEPGKQYLVFLRRTAEGWATYGFSLGKFEYVVDDLASEQILIRGGVSEGISGWDESNNAPHVERSRNAVAFRTFVKILSASPGAPARSDYFVGRRDEPIKSSSFSPKPEMSAPGGLNGTTAIAAATGNWTGAGAGVHYGVGANNPNASGGLSPGQADGINAVLFNDPCGIIPPGVAAAGGISAASGTYKIPPDNVTTYFNTTEVDVVVGKNFSTNQATFNGLMTHEIGHTLGFRHSDQNGGGGACTSPCTSNAIMNSTVAFNLQTLQQWDRDAIGTVYGGQTGTFTPKDYLLDGNFRWQSLPSVNFDYCFAATINTQPANVTIAPGAQTTLNVGATGTNATYQWYVGNSGNTSTMAPNGTTSSLTVSPAATTTYWVRVRACPSACLVPVDSNSATVTVAGCVPPSAPAPSAVPSTIASGQSSTISETPTGSSPFTYQWYVGNTGVTTAPIGGATNSSVSVSPTTTTSYWVRVTGQCAPPADSPVATVTVAPCVPPSASTPIASPSSVPSGQTSTIVDNPSGTSPFTYQWYVGNSPSTAAPINSATNSFVSVNPTVTTTYWVRVTGQCSPPSDSRDVTVTVTCSPINGSPNAAPSTINPGQSSTLAVATSGAGPFTFQWYNGNPGDTSSPMAGATGQSTPVSPITTSIYWVRVTSPCGSQDAGVTVNVNGVCNPPSITTQPASSTTSPGTPVTVTVSAGGTAPFTYQWFTGDKGDTSHPIAGATSFSLTQSPSLTTKYWVRVSHPCDSQTVDSNAATITVSSCANPSITTQPANMTVGMGSTATLRVVAAGTSTLHYQWFQGVKGDTSKPAGNDSATLITGVIKNTTSFWVHVTNQCANGTPADSNAATVTAVVTRIHAVRH